MKFDRSRYALALPLLAAVFAVAAAANGGTRTTLGLVSGVERSFRGPGGRLIGGSIEHTAPLAPGSSGSPIVDGEGRLLGLQPREGTGRQFIGNACHFRLHGGAARHARPGARRPV